MKIDKFFPLVFLLFANEKVIKFSSINFFNENHFFKSFFLLFFYISHFTDFLRISHATQKLDFQKEKSVRLKDNLQMLFAFWVINFTALC
jgi:hypothetical protein